MEAYLARFYDRYFVGLEGDVEFYVQQARRTSGPVLELGCGTGRLLVPLARAGIEAAGLDLDGALLKLARDKLEKEPAAVQQRVSLVEADMRHFSLERRFSLVIVPYRTFQHLLTPVDQEEVLVRLYEHLEEEGLLALDVFDPLQQLVEEGFTSPLRKDTDFVDVQTGHQIAVWYSRQCDPQTQIAEQDLIYEEIDAEGRSMGRTHARLALRWANRWEMQYLLESCGFAVEALYGDFAGSPYPGYGEQVWVARRVSA